ncbi:MAG: hypothetical protein KKA90_02390 [Nanoarchaeota archaeon]|nr:hypothetical protein [Nanoarchaeota archaeon]
MKRNVLFVFILTIIISLSFSVIVQGAPLRVDFFFSPGCPHCSIVSEVLATYNVSHPGLLDIRQHNVGNETELFIQLQQAYGVPVEAWGGVPKVFVADYYCIGSIQCDEELRETLDTLLAAPPDHEPPLEEENDIVSNNVSINPYQILGLAAVDAVNPCALAVLTLILVAILIQNPEHRHKVLTAGFAFTLAIFITYFAYGVIIVHLFQAALEAVAGVGGTLSAMLGLFAIVLGLLNLKDVARYKPGGLGTEMPMRMRPGVKKLLAKATGAPGAFLIGIFVTLFLLPCTIGPYIITGGILAGLSFVEILPWLLLYNIIFVLPMLAIVLIVYAGFTTVENVSGWKEQNIRYLHLVAGLLMLAIGAVLVLGWV